MAGEEVMVVDDNPVNLKLLAVLLKSQGYRVQTARDAEEALVMLDTLRPRMVLLDFQLPGMDGMSLARKLRADPVHRDLVIVAVTANAMKGTETLALEAGCDGYVTKPVDTRALPPLLAGLLAASRGGG